MRRSQSRDSSASPETNFSPSRSSTGTSAADFCGSWDALCPAIQIVGNFSSADELPEEIWTALSRLCCGDGDGSDGATGLRHLGFTYTSADADAATGNRIVIALADSVNIIEAATSSHSLSSNGDSEAGGIQFHERRVSAGESYELTISPNCASRASLLGRNETDLVKSRGLAVGSMHVFISFFVMRSAKYGKRIHSLGWHRSLLKTLKRTKAASDADACFVRLVEEGVGLISESPRKESTKPSNKAPKFYTIGTQTSQNSSSALRADDSGPATAASLGFDGRDFARKSDPAREVWKAIQQRQFTDIVVRIDNTQHPCHKVLLCAYSDYFNVLHREGTLDALIHLDKDWVSSGMFESFLDWCYGEPDEATRLINEENVACLSLCARRLGVAGLKQQCYQFISMLSSLPPSSAASPPDRRQANSFEPAARAETRFSRNDPFVHSPPFMRSAERISSKMTEPTMTPMSNHGFRHTPPSVSGAQCSQRLSRFDDAVNLVNTSGDPSRQGIHQCSLESPVRWSLPAPYTPPDEGRRHHCCAFPAETRPSYSSQSPRLTPQFCAREVAGSSAPITQFEPPCVGTRFERNQTLSSDYCLQNPAQQSYPASARPEVTGCPSFPSKKQGSLSSPCNNLQKSKPGAAYCESQPRLRFHARNPTECLDPRQSDETVNQQYSPRCNKALSSDFTSPAGTIYHSASSGILSPSAADSYRGSLRSTQHQGHQMYMSRMNSSSGENEVGRPALKIVSSRQRRRMNCSDDSYEDHYQNKVEEGGRASASWIEAQDPRETSSSLGELQQSVLKEVTRVFGHEIDDRRRNEEYSTTRSLHRADTGSRPRRSASELDEAYVNEVTRPHPAPRIPGGSTEDSRHAACVGSVENSQKVRSQASDDQRLLWAKEQRSPSGTLVQGSCNGELSSIPIRNQTIAWETSKPTSITEMRNVRRQPQQPSPRQHSDPSAGGCMLESKGSTTFNSDVATSRRHVSFHGVIDSTFDFTPAKDTHSSSAKCLLGSTEASSNLSAAESSLNRTSYSEVDPARHKRGPYLNSSSHQWLTQRSTPSQNSSMQSSISSAGTMSPPRRNNLPAASRYHRAENNVDGESNEELDHVGMLDGLTCHPPKLGAGIPEIICRLMQDHPSVLVLGGMNPMMGSGFTAESASYVLQYFPHLERWWGVTRLPEPRVHFSAVSYKGYVYVAGGGVPLLCSEDGDQPNPSAKCWRFRPDTGAWETLTDMPVPRMHHSSIVFRRKIYVLGGIGPRNQILSSVLCLNPNKNELSWESFPSLGAPRFGLASTCFRGMLWAVGGMTADFKPTSKVECYHPKRKRWISGPSLHIPRAFLQLANADNRLFVIGGAGRSTSTAVATSPRSPCDFSPSNSPTPVASVGKPQFTTTALRGMHAVSSIDAWDNELENWVFSLDMEIPCHGHAVVSAGLTCKSAHVLQRVARFDCGTQKWTELQPLPYGLTGHSATLLPPMDPTSGDDGP